MNNETNLRVALVTGGSRGIGRAISERLAREGFVIVVNYHSRQESAVETCQAIEQAGGIAWEIQADVTKQEEVRSLFEAIRARHGRLDVLVNNAGRLHQSLFALTSPDRFWEVLRSNLMGAVLCSQAAVRMMLRQRQGIIINISSVAGIRGSVGLSAYGAAKAALNNLTQGLAREVASKGIRVNAVAPSWVDTEMIDEANREAIEENARRIPLGRIAKPEEVAAVVAALVRGDMSYLVGQVIALEGGGIL